MNIIKSYTTNNPCYKNNTKITVKGLMLHSVGCAQPKAEVFVKQFDKVGLQKAVHAFIDFDTGDIYKCLPWSVKAWHCGGKGNSTHIGIEMCEPSSKGGDFTVCYNSAVELFAYLCKKFNLCPLTDITSHYEGYKAGIASNHADPKPLLTKYGKTMDQFREDVKKAMI
jgi:N-acetylmuramoyl-L-alanine amidase CwlA